MLGCVGLENLWFKHSENQIEGVDTNDFWRFALGGGGRYFDGDIIQQGGVVLAVMLKNWILKSSLEKKILDYGTRWDTWPYSQT